MSNQRRTILVLALLASVTAAVACNNDTSSSAHNGNTSKGGQAGSGGSGGGSSAKGGTAGNASGGNTATGGTAGNAGGAGGRSGGAGGAAGKSNGGSDIGGSAAGGAAGGAGGQNNGGSGGTGKDAGGDSANADASADLRADGFTKRDTGKADVDSACPANQTLCDGTCVNTSTSSTNCGGCGNACGSDQVCSGGSCMGSTANDGCSNTLASNLTLQSIAVYQTVKIPIMNGGTEVAMATRNAAVVNGRPTVVRVFVTPGSNWTARELSARLTVVPSDGSQPTVYTSKKTISVASTDADTKSTFQFNIPAGSMVTPLNYSVEVVECGTTSGTAGQARFPSSGTIDMGVRKTGGLKVTLIPLKYGTLVPDTSATAMAPYLAEMMAFYPITDLSFSVGDTLTVTSVDDWSGMLDQVRAKRSADKPAADVYYFGLIKPAADLRTYCKSSCITGIGFVVTSATGSTAGSSRVAMGIAFGDSASTETMAHELGHNHGRNHVNCSTAGTITGIDTKYPYSTKSTGVWGYDSRTQALLDPAKYVDLMSYCSPVWISDYNYSALVTRVAAVDGIANVLTVNAEMAKWRIILLDERGPRWGIPLDEPGPAEGEPETATIYDGTGEALTSVRVYRTEISDISAAMYQVPEPKENWYAISVAGAPPLPFAAPMPKL